MVWRQAVFRGGVDLIAGAMAHLGWSLWFWALGVSLMFGIAGGVREVRRGLILVIGLGCDGRRDVLGLVGFVLRGEAERSGVVEPESLILAQNERWRQA